MALLASGCVRFAATDPWVASWATAPQPAMPGAVEAFADQQVRLIVRTTLGGRAARIRLSNAYGTAPLEIGAARIARRTAGDQIDASGERALTFGGRASVTLAPGATRTSDELAFDVPESADLAVTLFLRGAPTASTNHFLALQTSYVSAPGTRPDAPFVTARTITSWPFLTGIDVIPGYDAVTIAVFGDSTVDGDGSAENANRRYTDLLAEKLSNPAPIEIRYSIVNLGIIGNRLLRDSPGAGSDFGAALGVAGVTRFERDALTLAGITCVMVRIGVNDIGFPGSFAPRDTAVTAAQLADGFRRLAAAAHAHSVRLVATTLAPFEGIEVPGYHTPDKETVRIEINEWLRATDVFDGLIDADAILRDPANPARLRAEFDSGDHLHPNDAGSAAIAAAVPIDICTREPGSGRR